MTYAAAVAATHPEIVYRATCERHLAPPKTSQPDAEVHGCFDEAIGSSDPDDHQAMLLVALREAGTFFDRSIPSLTDPGDPIEVDYLRLEHGPGADPLLLVDLDDLDAEPGRALAPGQYLVADTEQLVLPYLPDPLANGISLRFPDAGLDRPGPDVPVGHRGTCHAPRRRMAGARTGADRAARRCDGIWLGHRQHHRPRAPTRRHLAGATCRARSARTISTCSGRGCCCRRPSVATAT
ncbi:MAG: hypothetical protein WKF58_15020 [Ilumatobacteraceae bacterium]